MPIQKGTQRKCNHMANYLMPYDCNVMEHNICEKWLSYRTMYLILYRYTGFSHQMLMNIQRFTSYCTVVRIDFDPII